MSKPLTPQEEADAKAAWEARRASGAAPYTYLPATLESGARGWYTIPKPIRFVVWVYTILAIIGIISAAVWALVLLIGGGIALSQM